MKNIRAGIFFIVIVSLFMISASSALGGGGGGGGGGKGGGGSPPPPSGESLVKQGIDMNKGYFYGDTLSGGPFDSVVQIAFGGAYPQPGTTTALAYKSPPKPLAGLRLAPLQGNIGINALMSNGEWAAVPWTTYGFQKGDILHMSDTSTAIGFFISGFSAITHAGMYYDGTRNFESWGGGVDLYNRAFGDAATWNKQPLSMAVKRLKAGMSSLSPTSAVESALQWYRYKPFYTVNSVAGADPIVFTTNWSDKNTYDSFYCSKLVWRTYMNMGVDLDSNWTKSSYLFKTLTGINDWIGVSPDDLFWSGYTWIIWAKGNLNGMPIYY